MPGNFEQGAGVLLFTAVLLMILGGTAFGGLWIAIYDFWRYARSDDFLLVMTPDDFLLKRPRKTIHVPMDCIDHVTMRGVKAPADAVRAGVESYQELQRGMFRRYVGFPQAQKKPSGAPSLAFVDTRTDREVLVATDNSFDELPTLEYVLQLHVDAKKRVRTT